MIVSKLKIKFLNRKKNKVIFRTNDGKKLCTLKFTDHEMYLITFAAQTQNIDVQQFFRNIIKEAAGQKSDEL